MEKLRIIPRLDIKGPNVVKGIHAEGLRVIGEPKSLARKYYSAGADEIVYMDIVASLYGRNIDFEILKTVAGEIFVPLTVGGGIRSVHDISNVLRSGADKIAVNTFAVKNPHFIEEAVRTFGSQCVVLSVEAKKVGEGKWEAYTDGGREKSGRDAIEWIKQGIELGAGEVLLMSIDKDGTRQGFDIELISAVTSFSPVPVIAHGGAGSMDSVFELYKKAKPDAVAAASVFHYGDYSIGELKRFLRRKGITVRL